MKNKVKFYDAIIYIITTFDKTCKKERKIKWNFKKWRVFWTASPVWKITSRHWYIHIYLFIFGDIFICLFASSRGQPHWGKVKFYDAIIYNTLLPYSIKLAKRSEKYNEGFFRKAPPVWKITSRHWYIYIYIYLFIFGNICICLFASSREQPRWFLFLNCSVLF